MTEVDSHTGSKIFSAVSIAANGKLSGVYGKCDEQQTREEMTQVVCDALNSITSDINGIMKEEISKMEATYTSLRMARMILEGEHHLSKILWHYNSLTKPNKYHEKACQYLVYAFLCGEEKGYKGYILTKTVPLFEFVDEIETELDDVGGADDVDETNSTSIEYL